MAILRTHSITLTPVVMAIFAISLSETPTLGSEISHHMDVEDQNSAISFQGLGRSLKQYRPAPRTCDKYPGVCRARGSAAPNCCNKRCVNLKTDRLNCGKCGKRCNFRYICCQGDCVNPSVDERHCGRCNNRCLPKGSSCALGLCSYA